MFDIGVNLSSPRFANDQQQGAARARAAGVTGILITGTYLPESLEAGELTQRHAGYYWATAGVHPHYACGWNDEVAGLAARHEVVAIGECGLDFNRNFSTPEQHEVAFSAQLAMPVFLHCREAHARFAARLAPWLGKLPATVVHCFTGTAEELQSCLSLGLTVGIIGWICDERRGLELRALLPQIPAERLLLETDAPYLLPRDLHPKPASRRNEPCFLPHILRQVAAWQQEDPVWLGQKTDENTHRLFRLVRVRRNL